MTTPMTTSIPTYAVEDVATTLARHIPLYRRHAPKYQTVMLNALSALWQGNHRRLLDVGGGTGIIGQAIQDLFPVEHVESIDVEDRFLPNLTIASSTYDGSRIPFGDACFDAATFNNVLHHVPVAGRAVLIREVRRVVTGPVYIKDHLARGAIDHLRLAILDLMGNLPFSGMLSARYLTQGEWDGLAAGAGYRIAAQRSDRYRSGAFAWLFPNRLEISMRWEPLA